MSESRKGLPVAETPASPQHEHESGVPTSPTPFPSLAGRGDIFDVIPTFQELLGDPEIAALLDFEPVPRKVVVEGGWDPESQREFIARCATHGSVNRACTEMGKHRTGLTKLQNSPGAKGFREALDGAVALSKRRRAEAAAAMKVAPRTKLPTVDLRRKWPADTLPLAPPHQREGVVNEYGEWEDDDAFERRHEEAMDRMRGRLLNARRLYLSEICDSPGKRAAFEILTNYEVDWDKARRLQPQDDEPVNRCNQRQTDMILTAESGWSWGEWGFGEDKMSELRRALDEHRAGEGLGPVEWE